MLAKPERPNPRAIVDSVTRSAELVKHEQRIADLGAELQQRQNVLTPLYRDVERNKGSIAALTAEMEPLTAQWKQLRQRARELRPMHGEAVAVALDPTRQAAAAALIDLLVEADAHWSIIEETTVLIERAGGSRTRLPRPDISRILHDAQRIARAAR